MVKSDLDVKKMNARNTGYKRGVKEAMQEDANLHRNLKLLEEAEQWYNSLSDFRERRRRARRYYRGRQWNDMVKVNGKWMTEEEYIKMQGRVPLKQNLIRPAIKSVLGQYRCSPYKPVVYSRNRQDQTAAEMMTIAYEAVYEMNSGKERDTRELEEFLISGMAAYKIRYEYDADRQRPEPKFCDVKPSCLFFNTNVRDVRLSDVFIVGEVIDTTLDSLIASYACTKEEEERIKSYYQARNGVVSTTDGLSSNELDHIHFLTPEEPDKCRVVEIWKKEGAWRLYVHDYADGTYEEHPLSDKAEIDAVNAERRRMEAENGVELPMIEYDEKYVEYWKGYHLTPTGQTLWEGESPYEHKSHPYVICAYPMLDSEVWGMVEDIIDQQRMINRMVILQDFIMSASAKGVLVVPEECIPDDSTIEDIAEEWVKYNGVIKVKLKKGAEVPRQLSANSMNIGIQEMLQMQMKFIEDISGVQAPMLGKTPNSGTPAALYNMQTQQSALNILDYLETFGAFLRDRDKKVIQVIRQFYTEKQYITVAGRAYSEQSKMYDPERIRNIDFENSIGKGMDTPVYRAIADDMLWQMLQSGYITFEMFLEHSSMPFADKLMESVNRQPPAGQRPEANSIENEGMKNVEM